MIRNILLATAALAVVSAAPANAAPRKASASASATLPASNPFAKPSTLPFETPDFARIKDSDYLPALLAGMAQQKREVTAIANQTATPTFDNTVVAMERSGLLLERANLAFNAVNGANTNDTLQATDTKTAPLFAAHNDFIYLNAKLFQRFKYLHDHQAELNLNPEQAKLLDVYYKQFVHAGAELPPAKQAQLKIINKRLSTLQSAFGQKLLAAAKAGALHVEDPSALAGLSRAAACRRAGGGEGPQAQRLCHPAAEHDAAAVARFADQPRHAAETVRSEPQPRRAWRRQRHARNRQRARAAARQESGAVRRRELRRLQSLRPDGEGPRDRRRLP